MKLDKSDALLIHSVLFAYVNARSNMDHMDVDHLQDLQERLRDFIVDDSPVTEQEQDTDEEYEEEEDDYDDSEEEEEEEEENDVDDEDEWKIDTFVSPEEAGELSPITVTSPDGSKVTLEFEDVDEHDNVDALLDDGTVILEGVTSVAFLDGLIRLYDGENLNDFKVRKLPKSWTKLFPKGTVVGFEREEE